MAKILRLIGLTWCYGAGALIFGSLIVIALRDGVGQAFEVMSPLNIANMIVTAAALAPGLFCLWWSDKLVTRERMRDLR